MAKELIFLLMGENREHSKRWRSLTWVEDWADGITLWDFAGFLPPIMPTPRQLRIFGLIWGPMDEERWLNKTTLPFPRCPTLCNLELVCFKGHDPQDPFFLYGSLPMLTYKALRFWKLHDLARLSSFYPLQTLAIRTVGGRKLLETCHQKVEGISDPFRTHCLALRDRPHIG